MKKLLALLFGLIFAFSAVGCNDTNSSQSSGGGISGNTPIVQQSSEDCYRQAFYKNMTKHYIIDKGVAKYCILLPENASEILEFAAQELNWFLYCSTGVDLPVVYEGDALPAGINNYISIGKTQAFANLNIDPKYDELSTDGFRVYVRNKNFYSISNVDRGSLYGCYDMLKRYINLRFLNRDATHYITDESVWFADYDFTCVPEFGQRSFLAYNMQGNEAWGPRTTMYSEFDSGVTGTPWAKELGNIHTITDYFVKPSEWKETHPELFSSYTNSAVEREDICWSNGITEDGKLDESKDVSCAKIVIDKIINYLKENPEKEFFMLGMADQHDAYCKCGVCVDREKMLGEKSGITTMFVNVVAEEVNKWAQSEEGKPYGVNHDVNIIQFAYYWALNPPVHEENGEWVLNHPLAKPNKYIYVRYAPLNANMAYSLGHEKQMQNYKNVVEGWSSICDNLMIYDYCTKLGLITSYLPHFSKLSEQAKYLKDNNFYYWMFEAEWTTEGVWTMDVVEYILQRLWWNIDADVQAIIEEYVTLYHGEVTSPYIMRFVTRMEDNLAVIREKDDLISTVFGTADLSVENYPRALLEQAMSDLNEAQKAIDNCPDYTSAEKEIYTKRLNEVKVIPESMMLYNYDSYYFNDNVGKIKLVTDYYNHANSIGLKKFHRNDDNGMTVQQYYDSIING